jgi:hypothetical protein
MIDIFKISTAIITVSSILLSSCYHEVDLNNYRSEEGESLLTLNSLVCPDSAIAVSATRTYFFSDVHNDRSYVKDLDIVLTINGEAKGSMIYDNSRELHMSAYKPLSGDRVEIRTSWSGKDVNSEDIVPMKCKIENIDVERRGPIAIYSNYDFVFTYQLTFTDDVNEDNYYFLQWDEVDRIKDVRMGERDFTHELVFRKLADQIHSTLPGWTPYSPYGLPFSDEGINGKTHTLTVEEIVQANNGTQAWKKTQMKRRFQLFSISKPYYDYLVSVLCNQTNDKGLEGGLIDLGIAEPVKVYSNINNGIGILGCYDIDTIVIDVVQIVGKIPENSN